MRKIKFQRREHDSKEPKSGAPAVSRFWGLAYLPYVGRFAGMILLGLAVILSSSLPETTWAAAGGHPFVIHETFQKAEPVKPQPVTHGIVGLDLLIQKGHYPLVHGVFRGTPAANQGLLPGDMILSVNGTPTLGKNVNQVDAMISDVPGEQITLTVQRGPQLNQVHLIVAALEELSPALRSDFSGLFGSDP